MTVRGLGAVALAATYLIEWVTSEQHYRFYRLTKEYSRQRALGERETDHQAVLFRTIGRS